ncbi:hypothetical protein [Falsirhodobacter xinxiangensis]|uniref:hypothetical protein n=1 Tax=Falsirhodobacter xinxiangensis TaxID=2530049 RepID=UPI0010AB0BA6|nr:hypothetical protein [Rhodobacter xinxiangensis]
MSNYRHGFKTSKNTASEYIIWNGMRARCLNKQNPNYHRYGGRGISICDRWAVDFVAFVDDMGMRPSRKHTLDRIDNDGDYTPENCRWATIKEQCRNRRSSKFLTISGQTKTAAEWSDETGISQSLIHARMKMGWTAEAAVTRPRRGQASKDGKTMHKADIYSALPFGPEVR